VAILQRPFDDPHLALLQQQVVITGRHEDAAMLERLVVPRMLGGQRAHAREDLRQEAAVLGRHVEDDADGRGQVTGQLRDQLREGLHSAHRGPDDDDVVVVAPGHSSPLGREDSSTVATPPCHDRAKARVIDRLLHGRAWGIRAVPEYSSRRWLVIRNIRC
jgi:hypothetical protein